MKKYNVIYADPAWSYEKSNAGRGGNSSAIKQYGTMTNEDIMNLPVPDITEKNAVCFMWVTVPLLPEGLATLAAWGFKYKTMLTWRKVMSLGMGYYFRGQCEHLIVGVKGKVIPFRQQVCNFFESQYDIQEDHVFQHKVGKHSQKPDHFRKLIDKAVAVSFPEPKKLELFARSREGFFPDFEYEGWDVWGNQVNNSITLSPPFSRLKEKI